MKINVNISGGGKKKFGCAGMLAMAACAGLGIGVALLKLLF